MVLVTSIYRQHRPLRAFSRPCQQCRLPLWKPIVGMILANSCMNVLYLKLTQLLVSLAFTHLLTQLYISTTFKVSMSVWLASLDEISIQIVRSSPPHCRSLLRPRATCRPTYLTNLSSTSLFSIPPFSTTMLSCERWDASGER